MHTRETQSIIASIPTDIYSQLQEFAIDNNFVTAVTGFPKVADCIHEITRIFTMAETNEEIALVIKLFFKPRKKKWNGVASTLMEMIDIVLEIHRDPKMKVARKVLQCTTLECLELIFLVVLGTYRKKGMQGDNIVDFCEEAQKKVELAVLEYVVSEGYPSLEDK